MPKEALVKAPCAYPHAQAGSEEGEQRSGISRQQNPSPGSLLKDDGHPGRILPLAGSAPWLAFSSLLTSKLNAARGRTTASW